MSDYQVETVSEEELEWKEPHLTVHPYNDVTIEGEKEGVIHLGCSSSGHVVLCECSLECLPMGELLCHDDWHPYHLAIITMTAEWIAGEREVAELWNGIMELEASLLEEE